MSKKLICKLHHEWGQTVNVAGTLYTIDKSNGEVEVSDEHAKRLLANPAKWDDAATAVRPKPGRSFVTFKEANPDVPNVELKDPRTGRILNDDEALKALTPDVGTEERGAKGKRVHESGDPLVAQAAELRNKPSPKAIEAKVVEAESKPAPAAQPWPQVSEENTKAELTAVLERLGAAGVTVDTSAKATKSKALILDQIEKGYAALASRK